MQRITLILLLILSLSVVQAQKKALDHADVSNWNSIQNTRISDDGRWVTYQTTPIEGDPTLYIYDGENDRSIHFERASGARLSADSRYLVFTLKASKEDLKEMERKKTPKDKLPKDTLVVYNLASREVEKIPNVKSFQLPEKWAGWLAYHLEPEKNGQTDKKENNKNGSKLIVSTLDGSTSFEIAFAKQYTHAEEGKRFLIQSTGDDSTFLPGLYLFDAAQADLRPVFRSKGDYKRMNFDKSGRQLAFLVDLDTTEARIRPFDLFYWKNGQDTVQKVAGADSAFLPEGWIVSSNARPEFSKDGNKLYFGYAPEPILEDTSLLDDEIVKVEVWHYQDSRLYPQQKIQLNRDKNRSYSCVWHIEKGKAVTLGSLQIPDLRRGNEGDARYALGANSEPYQKEVSWEGLACRKLYIVDTELGQATQIAEKICGNPTLSPGAKYAYWYSSPDTAWFAYEIASGQTRQITNNQKTTFYNERDDHPMYPPSYRNAGWLANDEAILIYDRYDLWKIDPQGKQAPRRLTQGREQKTTYRYRRLDREARFIRSDEKILLHAFNEENKQAGYAWLDLKTGKTQMAEMGEYSLRMNPLKAKKAEKYVFTKENFQLCPDLLYGDNLVDYQKISAANPQQSEYNWGNIERYDWTSLDGQKLQGLLVKPDDFDPYKKYPLIVNFYERSTDGLYRHRAPDFHRSTINYAFYVSRGYLIFNPDVPYRIGYPGESAYNAVVSGVSNLVKEGFVDEANMALQGHSWGGYQIAYLLTKTDMFKCAESGAPVVNMISAYGGIRWGSGYSRMFQYEHTQSRIGGTLWEYPLRYLENSPIFTLDKINTPVLILHNDKDGAVPWYQGIEFFVGMRRLGKPAWMLNYNDEPHWPLKLQNRKDFNKRLQQFFDHYLKGDPMPLWMQRGVPAIEQGMRQGYELLEKN